jgi:PhnB protein
MGDLPPDVIPMISYRDGVAAMEWLAEAFGFQAREQWLDDDGVLTHGEMAAGNGTIMLGTPSPHYEGPRQHRLHCESAATWFSVPWIVDGVLVYVPDVHEHRKRAEAAGAVLLSDIEEEPYGRLYRAEDLEGHRWMFMERRV